MGLWTGEVSMKAKLIVVGGAAEETEVNLRLPAIIGRGRSVQITVPHSLVSRQHCEIAEKNGQLVVRDLGSMNGTYVGDEKISEAILPPGGLLTVGTVTFRALYEATANPQFSTQVSSGQRSGSSNPGDSTINGISAVDEDTARVDPGQLPDELLPPMALPATVSQDPPARSRQPLDTALEADASLENTE